MRFLCVSLGHFVLASIAFVELCIVSSAPIQAIAWEERLRNDLFCVEGGLKTLTQSILACFCLQVLFMCH